MKRLPAGPAPGPAYRLLACLILLAVTACGLPRPFAHDSAAPPDGLARLGTAGGVAVLPVSDAPAPLATAAADGLAEALQANEVPAAPVPEVRSGGYTVLGALIDATPTPDGRRSLVVAWEVRGPRGQTLLLHHAAESVDADLWPDGTAEVGRHLGRAAADAVAAAVLSDMERPLAQRMATAPPPAGPGNRERKAVEDRPSPSALVAVHAVEGLDAVQAGTLRGAMRSALRRRGVTVARDGAAAPYVVEGRVNLGTPQQGRVPIKIRWTLRTADGREVGTAGQANVVPETALDKGFVPLAAAIAAGGADGIVGLLRRVGAAAVPTE